MAPMGGRQSDRQESVSERLARLERENAELHSRLVALTDEAARNEALLRKTQERELDLLRAGSLAQLLERLINGLRSSYQLDAVSLLLHDPQHEIRHLLAGDGFALDGLAEVRFVDALITMAPQLAALASDFLAHLGVIAAICIENAVNRARLVRSGLTDFLTGFHNRRYLHARLTEELARAQRAHQTVACLMIDVDHFKRINDQYGHLAGDAVLRELAQRIDAEMRMSDTGARFGGDEFAIVLPQGGAADGAIVAQRVLNAVRSTPIAITPGVTETVTLSIGVAAAAPDPTTRDFKSLAERLMAEADAALYRAKGAGRNTIAVSEHLVA